MSEELPSGWTSLPFGELLIRIVGGGTPPKSNESFFRGKIPFLTVKDMHHRFPGDTVDHISREAVEQSATTVVPADTLIVATRMALGRVVRPKVETAINQDVKALFLKEAADKTFVEFWWRSQSQRIQSLGTGTTVQGIRLDDIRQLEMLLAPLAEQRRIVAKLEQVLGKVDASQRRLAKIPVLLKRFRQSVLAAACSGRLTADWREQYSTGDAASYIEAVRSKRPAKFQDSSVRGDLDLPEIPENWAWTNLRFLLSPAEAFCYGVVQPGENDPRGALLVRAGDLKKGRVETNTLRRIPSSIHDAYRRSQLNGGEILVTVVGAGIGETALAQQECAGYNIARAVVKLPVREFDARYVRHWLTTSRAVTWMKGDSREVARPTLNLEQLQTLPVPIPPLPEQQEIVRRVEELFALADKIEARYTKAQAQVDRLTPSLLARAFAGKLVPQDPADEPASVLLERIRGRSGPAASAGSTRVTAYPEAAPRELKVAEPKKRARRK